MSEQESSWLELREKFWVVVTLVREKLSLGEHESSWLEQLRENFCVVVGFLRETTEFG